MTTTITTTKNQERLTRIEAIKLQSEKIIPPFQTDALESLCWEILFQRKFENGSFCLFEGQIALSHDGQTRPHFFLLYTIDRRANKQFVQFLNEQCFSPSKKRLQGSVRPGPSM